MKTIRKIILSAVLLMSVSSCSSGKKVTEESSASSEVSEEKVKMEEMEIYGIKINVPENSTVGEKDGWTIIKSRQSDTGVKIKTISAAETGKIGAFCDAAEKEIDNDPERTDFMGGCRFAYMTETLNGTMTNPTSLYIYPVKNNEIYVLAIVYNMDFEESIKNADYKNAVVADTPGQPEETKEPEPTPEPEVTEEPQAEEEEQTTEDNSIEFEEFKKKIDDIEAFFDSYVEFMKSYDMTDVSMMSQYLDMLSKYEDAMNALDAIDESQLTPEEDAYYTQAMLRIDKKLIEAAEAMN